MPGEKGYLDSTRSVLLVTCIFCFHFRGLCCVIGVIKVGFCAFALWNQEKASSGNNQSVQKTLFSLSGTKPNS